MDDFESIHHDGLPYVSPKWCIERGMGSVLMFFGRQFEWVDRWQTQRSLASW